MNIAALGEICVFNYGEALKEEDRRPGEIPVYGSNGVVGWHNQAITTGPTIVIGRKGSIGEVHFSTGPCYPIDTTYFVDRTLIPCDMTWLFYMLKALDLTEMNKSAAVPGLNRDDAYRQCLHFPSLTDQRRIAAILRAADEERRRRRATQALSDGLLGEVFVQMFGDPATNPMGWEWRTVDELKAGSKYSCVGGPFGSNLTTDDYVANPGVPVIRGTNINSTATTFIDDDFVYVTEDKADSLVQNMAYPGDLIFTQWGTLGQVGYIPCSAKYHRYVVSQSQMKLTPNLTVCDPLYLYHFFLTGYALRRLQDNALTTGVPHINLDILRNFEVMLPPKELQEEFAAIAAQCEQTHRQQQESARQSDHLFETLLHRAFAGDL